MYEFRDVGNTETQVVLTFNFRIAVRFPGWTAESNAGQAKDWGNNNFRVSVRGWNGRIVLFGKGPVELNRVGAPGFLGLGNPQPGKSFVAGGITFIPRPQTFGAGDGDYEYIEFDREPLHKAAIRVIQMIWSLNPGKMQLSRTGPPGMSVDVLEAAIAAQPDEPMLRVTLAQQFAASGRLEAAMRELNVVLRSNPDFLPARLELIKGLQALGRLAEAMKELDRVMETDPLSAMAHHLKGHILEGKGDVEGAANSFKRAVECEPGSAHHYRCLGQTLFRAAKGNRPSLKKARDALKMAINLGGENESRLCRPHLKAIEQNLKVRPAPRASGDTKKNKQRRGKQTGKSDIKR
jgi:tetratricopeptide (TPR) repeat protein